jgi:DNA-binding winged helix-turn-helix (wHTH) protein
MGTPRLFRFNGFALDTRARALTRDGVAVKLTGQPYSILQVLLERAGEVVTRDELREKLWPDGTFVDFQRCLNTSIMSLRRVLQDSADTPRYIATISRVGYRFVAPVVAEGASELSLSNEPVLAAVENREPAGELLEHEGEVGEVPSEDCGHDSLTFGQGTVSHFKRNVTRYALAITVAGAALLMRKLLDPFLRDHYPYDTMWLAVLLAARSWSTGPAIATLVTGGLGTWYCIVPPVYSFQYQNPADVYGLISFVALSAVLIRMARSRPSESLGA